MPLFPVLVSTIITGPLEGNPSALQLSVTGACRRARDQLGINRDALRGWVKQAQIDAGARPGAGE